MADGGKQRTMLHDSGIWQSVEVAYEPRDKALLLEQGPDIVALSEQQWRALAIVLARLNAGKRIDDGKEGGQ